MFIVHKKGLVSGENPTLLYGYVDSISRLRLGFLLQRMLG